MSNSSQYFVGHLTLAATHELTTQGPFETYRQAREAFSLCDNSTAIVYRVDYDKNGYAKGRILKMQGSDLAWGVKNGERIPHQAAR